MLIIKKEKPNDVDKSEIDENDDSFEKFLHSKKKDKKKKGKKESKDIVKEMTGYVETHEALVGEGGPSSGNYDHMGIRGHRGGSLPNGGTTDSAGGGGSSDSKKTDSARENGPVTTHELNADNPNHQKAKKLLKKYGSELADNVIYKINNGDDFMVALDKTNTKSKDFNMTTELENARKGKSDLYTRAEAAHMQDYVDSFYKTNPSDLGLLKAVDTANISFGSFFSTKQNIAANQAYSRHLETVNGLEPSYNQVHESNSALLKTYMITQKFFKDRGIKSLTLYRGIGLPAGVKAYGHRTVASWISDKKIATSLAKDLTLKFPKSSIGKKLHAYVLKQTFKPSEVLMTASMFGFKNKSYEDYAIVPNKDGFKLGTTTATKLK
jgi:hypothetical protein